MAAVTARAALVVQYDFGATVATKAATTLDPHLTAGLLTPVGVGDEQDETGLTGRALSWDGWAAGGAPDAARYVGFTVTPTPGHAATYTNLTFQNRRSDGGAPDNWTVRWSTNGTTFTEAGTGTTADPDSTFRPVVVGGAWPVAVTGTLHVRIYGFNQGTASKQWRLDDIALFGSVAALVGDLPPTLAILPAGTTAVVRADSTLTLQLSAAESDGDPVSLAAEALPPGATFTPTQRVMAVTNVFTWTPGAGDIGATSVTFRAWDKDGTNRLTVAIQVHPEQSVILNEYNCVASGKDLGAGVGRDARFGRVNSNNANWLELVVVKDHVDLRGWKLYWAEAGDYKGDHDIWFGNPTSKQGIVTFSTNAVWSDLRRGTLLTIAEDEVLRDQTDAIVVNGTDLNFDPETGDWWMHVSTLAEFGKAPAARLLTTTNNIPDDGYGQGAFSVGHDDWELTLRDAAGRNAAGPIGEGIPGWGANRGANTISSFGAGRLETDPLKTVTISDYDGDTNLTTFGLANVWGDTEGNTQNFARLRNWITFTNREPGLVLNEYNAVGPTNLLANGDALLGMTPGNGGPWMEWFVTQDRLDVRGWRIQWATPGAVSGPLDGRDLWFGDAGTAQGELVFGTNAVWAGLRRGMVLTIARDVVIGNQLGEAVRNGSDVAVEPALGDWLLHVSTQAEVGQPAPLLRAHNNLVGEGDDSGNFLINGSNWQVRVVDAAGVERLSAIGEALGWGGGGLGSDEIGRLEAEPEQPVDIEDYEDADSSTFGAPNQWGDRTQDWAAARRWVEFEHAAAPVIVNEFNAVKQTNLLDNLGADARFGRVEGNGGNWIELVVVADRADLRGMILKWVEVGETPVAVPRDIWYGDPTIKQGILTFGTNALWRAVRAGTIITLAEDVVLRDASSNIVANGSDASFDAAAGDWWLHVSTLAEAGQATPLVTTDTNADGDGPGNFSTGHERWQVTLCAADGTPFFGPCGEAFVTRVGNLDSTETLRLEAAPEAADPAGYDDAASSTFGLPNVWGEGVVTQAFAALRAWAAHDADNDGMDDDWERTHFGNLSRDGAGDFDHDGTSDADEQVADTDPDDPDDRFAAGADMASDGVPAVSFRGATGRLYNVWAADTLTPPVVWTSLVADVEGSNAAQTIRDPTPRTNRFYRIDVRFK